MKDFVFSDFYAWVENNVPRPKFYLAQKHTKYESYMLVLSFLNLICGAVLARVRLDI